MRTKGFAGLLGILAVAALALAMVAPLAQAREPAPGYENFAGCPSPEEDPTIASCSRSVVNSGHFDMGNKSVPITNPITLSGGFGASGFTANSKGGMSLAKQKVPGGVIGFTGLDWLVDFLGIEALQLFAVTELAGQPEISGTAITLPLKVHMINPVLGSHCYVGSNSDPITLNLTTGTTSPPPPNEPISGSPAKLSVGPPAGVVHSNEGVFVDNSFAAPGANGCVLTLFGFIPISINGVVNLASSLPSAAGTNETVQQIDLELAPVKRVYP